MLPIEEMALFSTVNRYSILSRCNIASSRCNIASDRCNIAPMNLMSDRCNITVILQRILLVVVAIILLQMACHTRVARPYIREGRLYCKR